MSPPGGEESEDHTPHPTSPHLDLVTFRDPPKPGDTQDTGSPCPPRGAVSLLRHWKVLTCGALERAPGLTLACFCTPTPSSPSPLQGCLEAKQGQTPAAPRSRSSGPQQPGHSHCHTPGPTQDEQRRLTACGWGGETQEIPAQTLEPGKRSCPTAGQALLAAQRPMGLGLGLPGGQAGRQPSLCLGCPSPALLHCFARFKGPRGESSWVLPPPPHAEIWPKLSKDAQQAQQLGNPPFRTPACPGSSPTAGSLQWPPSWQACGVFGPYACLHLQPVAVWLPHRDTG